MNTSVMTPLKAPPFRKSEIAMRAEGLIETYVQVVGREKLFAEGLCFDDVYDKVIHPQYAIELIDDQHLGFDAKGHKVLGRFDIEENIAYLDSTIGIRSGDPRRAFTCWHEVGGHGILQGSWLREQLNPQGGDKCVITTEPSLNMATVNRLEWQANQYAAAASAPLWFVRAIITRTFDLRMPFRYVGPSGYGLDVRGVYLSYEVTNYRDLCALIADKIKHLFWGLSKESLSYHVAESGLVMDCSRRRHQLHRVA